MVPLEIITEGTGYSASERLVLLALAAEAAEQRLADPCISDADTVIVTQGALARRVGLSRSSVVRALEVLADSGLIGRVEIVVGCGAV